MAACNPIGSILGTHLALKHGAGLIPKAFLGVVVIPVVKQLVETL